MVNINNYIAEKLHINKNTKLSDKQYYFLILYDGNGSEGQRLCKELDEKNKYQSWNNKYFVDEDEIREIAALRNMDQWDDAVHCIFKLPKKYNDIEVFKKDWLDRKIILYGGDKLDPKIFK